MGTKAERRFVKALKSSLLVSEADLARALQFQAHAASRGRTLPLDRILLKLGLLQRDQILGLWHAIRYHVWRKEDKFYVKLALQSRLMDQATADACLREQKRAYKHDGELVRVNELARQRGYLRAGEDRSIVEAMKKLRAVTLRPVSEDGAAGGERPSPGAAGPGAGDAWRQEARERDLAALRPKPGSGELSAGSSVPSSDDDLDALWEEADLDDVELDSQAIEIARAPADDDEDDDIEIID